MTGSLEVDIEESRRTEYDFNNLWLPLLLGFLPSGSTWFHSEMSWNFSLESGPPSSVCPPAFRMWNISHSFFVYFWFGSVGSWCTVKRDEGRLHHRSPETRSFSSPLNWCIYFCFAQISHQILRTLRQAHHLNCENKQSSKFNCFCSTENFSQRQSSFTVWLQCLCLCSPLWCCVHRWMISAWPQSPTRGPSQCCGSRPSSDSPSCRRKVSNRGIHGPIITLPLPPLPPRRSPLRVPTATLPPVTTPARSCRWRWWRVSAANRSESNSSASLTRAGFSSWTCCLGVWQQKMENWGTMTKCWPLMDTTSDMVHRRALPRSYRYTKGSQRWWLSYCWVNFCILNLSFFGSARVFA